VGTLRSIGAPVDADRPRSGPVPSSVSVSDEGGLGGFDPVGGRPPRVVRVVPDVAALRRPFDYLVPEDAAGAIGVGTRVRVVLNGRRVAGWVVALDVDPPPGLRLRPLASVQGFGPPPAVVDLAHWAAWRWAGAVSAFLGAASSPTLVRGLPDVARPRSPRHAGPAPVARTAVEATHPEVGSGPGANGHRRARAHGPDGEDTTAPEVVTDALAGGIAVVELPPGDDGFALVRAAAELLFPTDGGASRVDPDGPPGVLVLAPSERRAMALSTRLREAGYPVALLPGQWAMARAGG
jgi:hypothetical protein